MTTNTDQHDQSKQIQLAQYCPDLPQIDESAIRPPIETIELIGKANDYLPPTRNRDYLPDLEGYAYHAKIDQYDTTEVIRYWQLNTTTHWSDDDIDPEPIPGSAGVIVKHADKYLREYALAPIDIPQYYSRFGDMDPVYRWSADGATYLHGYDLKRCVRLTNGTGRIDVDSTQLILCGPGTVVATGPRGVFLIDILSSHSQYNDSLPDPPVDVFQTVNGTSIPEENPACRYGFKRFTDLLEETDLKPITEYHEFSTEGSLAHTLKTASQHIISLSGSDLEKLSQYTDSRTKVASRHYERYCDGETYTAEVHPSDLPGEIGDRTTIDGVVGYIAGYGTQWAEEEYIYTRRANKLRLNLTTVLITEDYAIKELTTPLIEFNI